LVDIVSKNGNLLLDVGPEADGTIPPVQMSRLEALGSWLGQNGEAIYGTHPWKRAAGETSGGTKVRFTAKSNSVYATLLGKPSGGALTLKSFTPKPSSKLFLLGIEKQLSWSQHGEDTVIDLPSTLPGQFAYVIKVVQP
jgi:alpha-L-fucosidase